MQSKLLATPKPKRNSSILWHRIQAISWGGSFLDSPERTGASVPLCFGTSCKQSSTFGSAAFTTGTVFSLCSRNIYRLAGQDRIRNHRDHGLNYIQTRIGILDFVLQNLDNRYLETETGKLTYFCSEKKVPANELPSRAFGGRYLAKPTVLYFTDGNPIFFATESAPVETVTFSYFQGTEVNLAGFTRHLQSHMPLFYRIEKFNFCFLARSDVRFDKAAELFRDIVIIPLQSNPAEDLLRYFAIRKAWNLSQYSSLTEGDLIFRNNAKERFRGERFENLYRAWKSNRTPESEIVPS